MSFVSLNQALELKMILKVLIVLPLPIFFIFLALALKHLHKSILISGILVSFIYFVGATEGIVWAYNHYSFFFDPYGGGYRFAIVNIKYHWPYYAVLFFTYFVGIVIYFIKHRAAENAVEYQITKSALATDPKKYAKKYERVTLE
jgi:hypothetical protein